jgi:hypothetical protein
MVTSSSAFSCDEGGVEPDIILLPTTNKDNDSDIENMDEITVSTQADDNSYTLGSHNDRDSHTQLEFENDVAPIYWSNFKARVVRTALNPTMTQVLRCEDLQEWRPSVREFIDSGLEAGIHKFISDAEAITGGYRMLPHVSVFNTKRDGTKKYRLAPDGGKELVSEFEPGSLVSSGIDSSGFNFIVAFGAYHDMACSTSDIKQAYPNHNRWDDPACKNPRRVCIRLKGKKIKIKILILLYLFLSKDPMIR